MFYLMCYSQEALVCFIRHELSTTTRHVGLCQDISTALASLCRGLGASRVSHDQCHVTQAADKLWVLSVKSLHLT